ncbi:MAG: DUF3943 domain-containing protein [Candidatus Dadabacteria bacterium]|nr:DUF3943 domain-containing protein [Candidatus Dadabacteria bacterium]NIS09177.1 DUF3943 domain-containing protein [Candidatus Dadabacteria bacterium]NIY22484.1 DUF3943 domain-containing protein [Candidatus Dadabacteria bacterium]
MAIFAFSSLCSPLGSYVLAEEASLQKPEVSESDEPQSSDEYRSAPSNKDFLKDSAYLYGGLWAGRFFYVRNKNSRIFDTSISDWIDNITQWPETDDGDEFFTNFITHPYIGSMYYLYYRERGHSRVKSALGSVLQSTLFEYTIEGLVETPSLPDLIFTPLVGAPLGEVFVETSQWLSGRDNVVVRSLAYVVNPMKIIIDDRKFGFVNPLSGTFGFHGTFEPKENKAHALRLSYSNFVESPIPVGRIMTATEVVNVRQNFGGEFITYYIRADLPNDSNTAAVYFRLFQAGLNSININGEDPVSDGFELANLLLGGKHLIYNTSNKAVAMGFEFIVPSAYKDNVDRLKTLVKFQRDLPYFLESAFTTTPYITGSVWNEHIALQANLGTDIIINSDKFEDDDVEWRIKYAASMAAELPIEYDPTFHVDFLGIYIPTADTIKNNDLFISPGFRIGRQYDAGFSMQFPLTGPSDDVAKFSFVIDLQARF